ncbi:MAG: right-handed parallel beta-helix repeat-containing protein [Polyangiales bacterium]
MGDTDELSNSDVDPDEELFARDARSGGVRAPRTSIFDRGTNPFGRRRTTPTTTTTTTGSKPATTSADAGATKPTTAPIAPTTPTAPGSTRVPGGTSATVPPSAAGTFHVSPQGNDSADGSERAPFRTIASALKRVNRGTIVVHGGTYPERLVIKHTGTSDADYLNLVAAPNERVELTGKGAGQGEEGNMIYMQNASYVRVDGFRIVGDGVQEDVSGVRLMSAGHHIEILNNEISEIRGESAMGITVYGKDGAGITDLVIRGNKIHDCDPAPSEALTLNGNVQRFQVIANEVRDVNNIGIDVIGGETWLSRAYPSDGVVSDNFVTRANSTYDGSAACIYVDGASKLTIERNRVSECDYGIEVGAENRQVTVTDVVVRNNFVHHNYRGGIIFGGYDAERGRVTRSHFVHNSLYKNNRPKDKTRFNYQGGANGEIIVQYASDCELSNNILYGIREASSIGSVGRGSSSNMRWANNLFFREGARVNGLPDTAAIVSDPRFLAPDNGDLHIRADSPARAKARIDAMAGSDDIDGQPRANGGNDVGADEL